MVIYEVFHALDGVEVVVYLFFEDLMFVDLVDNLDASDEGST